MELSEDCICCDGGIPLVTGETNDYGIAIHYPNKLVAYGYSINGYRSNGLTAIIKYCPICGKKLEGELII